MRLLARKQINLKDLVAANLLTAFVILSVVVACLVLLVIHGSASS